MAYGAIIYGLGDGSSEANAINIDSVSAYQYLTQTDADWGKCFKQSKNIDFVSAGDISPIGDVTSSLFTGIYDGNNKVIKNITISQSPDQYNSTAMFRRTGSPAVIKNLKVTNANVVGTCNTDVVNNLGKSYAAILVGENQNGATVQNCDINGALSHTHTKTSSGDSYAIIGMVVGANHGLVENCSSSGTISAVSNVNNNYLSIGGVVGQQTGVSGGKGYTIGCYSTVSISNSTTDQKAAYTAIGGIAGMISVSGVTINEVNTSIFDGTISWETDNAGYYTDIGGIAGRVYGKLHQCEATCSITADSVATTAQQFKVGGIAGNGQPNSTISECSSNSSISVRYVSESRVGGGFGMCETTTITNCYTRGSLFDLVRNANTLNFSRGGGFSGSLSGCTANYCFASINSYSAYNNNIYNVGFAYTGGAAIGGGNGLFWDSELSTKATDNATNTVAKTTSLMKQGSTFTGVGYDFVGETDNGTANIWNIDGVTNNGYPFLTWKSSWQMFGIEEVPDITDVEVNHVYTIPSLSISATTNSAYNSPFVSPYILLGSYLDKNDFIEIENTYNFKFNLAGVPLSITQFYNSAINVTTNNPFGYFYSIDIITTEESVDDISGLDSKGIATACVLSGHRVSISRIDSKYYLNIIKITDNPVQTYSGIFYGLPIATGANKELIFNKTDFTTNDIAIDINGRRDIKSINLGGIPVCCGRVNNKYYLILKEILYS